MSNQKRFSVQGATIGTMLAAAPAHNPAVYADRNNTKKRTTLPVAQPAANTPAPQGAYTAEALTRPTTQAAPSAQPLTDQELNPKRRQSLRRANSPAYGLVWRSEERRVG